MPAFNAWIFNTAFLLAHFLAKLLYELAILLPVYDLALLSSQLLAGL